MPSEIYPNGLSDVLTGVISLEVLKSQYSLRRV